MLEPSRAVTTVNAAADDALGSGDTVDLLDRLRRREVSPAQVRQAALARLAAVNPVINAVVCPIDRVTDAEPDEAGPFAGVPLPIKDTDDVAGLPTLWGSAALRPQPAAHTSPFVRQLLSLGFVPIAKSTMPEFGLTATTQSVRFGDTRNPWDTARSVGGSSGGSAALVAAGVVTMAHCNDGGGSTRIPAATCGLVGLKPSRGRLLDRPELERTPINLFTQGVLTRSVRDTAHFYAAAEQRYRNPALPPIGLVEAPLQRPLRIAVVLDGLSGIVLGREARVAVEHAAALCEALGHRIDVVGNPYPDGAARDFLRYWSFLALTFQRAGRFLFPGGFDASQTTPFTQGLAEMGRVQFERVPAALRRLRRLARSGGPLFDRYDVVLSPTLGHAPPRLEWLAPDVPFGTHLVRLMRYVTETPLENVSGAPAISLPLARTADGVPLGVQFSTDIGGEALLLGLAYALEAAAPWPTGPVVIPVPAADRHSPAAAPATGAAPSPRLPG